MSVRPTFIVDWDGTLVSDHAYPNQGEWLPGAVEALHAMIQRGRVVIYSLRLNPYQVGCDGDESKRRPFGDVIKHSNDIRRMLVEQGLHGVEIHETPGKPAGTYYIDNQAVEFTGDWDSVLDRVLRRTNRVESCVFIPTPEDENRYLGPSPLVDPDDEFLPGVRQFLSGATRNLDTNKHDYEAFFSPLVLRAYGEYMHSHRFQKDGELRDGDNWQKGIPLNAYMKSAWRHLVDWWSIHRDVTPTDPDTGDDVEIKDALCALIFNASGYLHEIVKAESA